MVYIRVLFPCNSNECFDRMQSEFKDGYWKPFSYYEKLFSVGKTISIVYEIGSMEKEFQIKEYKIVDFENFQNSETEEIVIHSIEGIKISVLFSTPAIDFLRICKISAHSTSLTQFLEIKELVIDGVNIIGLQPLTIPPEYAVKTLKKRTRIYRQARKEEPIDEIDERKEYYFYADDPLYNFEEVATSTMSRVLETKTGLYKAQGLSIPASGVYEYALTENIKVVDLTTGIRGKKVWRCNIFSNGTGTAESVSYCAGDKNYEKALIEACKQLGCVGFRAYVKADNGRFGFDDDVYAELALLGSSPVVRIDCLKKGETSDMVPRIQELEEDLEEERETNDRLQKELENLEKELEKMRAGGTPQGTSKRKRTNYSLHL